MTPQCTFILSNGKKCRCAATRNLKFCRHHAPKPPGPPIPKDERLTRVRRWGSLHRALPRLAPADIPIEAYDIFEALLRDGPTGISDREAGRLLRALFRRLGSIPFPYPELSHPSPMPAFTPIPSRPPSPAATALLAKIGGTVDGVSDEEILQAWSEITSSQPAKHGRV